jgi:zinc and cadmium transporter
MMLLWITGATLFGGVLSAALASVFLGLRPQRRARLQPHLISFATGAMLAASLLGLLPEAIERAGPSHLQAIGASVLAGIGLFFILEKLVLWRHCHGEQCDTHAPTSAHRDRAGGWIVLVGTGVHNAFDGVLIAAAFLSDIRLGLMTSIAITAHEVPQELGDLAVLLQAGIGPKRALLFNLASSLTSILGGLAGYFALHDSLNAMPYAICVAAASLLYVAVADLIPGLHRRVDPGAAVTQVMLIAAGVVSIWATQLLFPDA